MSRFTSVHQINIRVKDMATSVAWYRDKLGMTIAKDYGSTVVLELEPDGATALCLIELESGDARPTGSDNGTHPVLSLRATHAERCRDHFREQGVWVDGSKGHFKFKDPDGNLLEAYLPGLYDEAAYAHLR